MNTTAIPKGWKWVARSAATALWAGVLLSALIAIWSLPPWAG